MTPARPSVAQSRVEPDWPGHSQSATRTGDVTEGIAAAEAAGATVFCAGVSADDEGRLVTAGGRVLAVTGSGVSLAAARDAAYSAVDLISWPGMQKRTDIARWAAGQ